jgi:hypothetical protein
VRSRVKAARLRPSAARVGPPRRVLRARESPAPRPPASASRQGRHRPPYAEGRSRRRCRNGGRPAPRAPRSAPESLGTWRGFRQGSAATLTSSPGSVKGTKSGPSGPRAQAQWRAPISTSSLPLPPRIGEVISANTVQPGVASIKARTAATALARACASRTTSLCPQPPAGREVRRHQGDEPGVRRGEAEGRRQRLGEADKAQSATMGPLMTPGVEAPRISPFQAPQRADCRGAWRVAGRCRHPRQRLVPPRTRAEPR